MTFAKGRVKIGFASLLISSCVLLLYVAGLLPMKPNWDTEKPVEVSELPSIQELHKLSHRELAILYHRYINTVQVLCKRIVRIGTIQDGGWELCEDKEFIPSKPCLVYSFGINYDFSFDDQMAERFNCDVYSFDPSMDQVEQGKRGRHQWFYQVGLADKTRNMKTGWNVSTYHDILKRFGHTTTKIDVLKIDIEKYEWLSLIQIYENGGLQNIGQLLIEFHIAMVGEPERLEYIQALGVLRYLYDSGLRIVYSHRNPFCSFLSRIDNIEEVGCHELSFVHIP